MEMIYKGNEIMNITKVYIKIILNVNLKLQKFLKIFIISLYNFSFIID